MTSTSTYSPHVNKAGRLACLTTDVTVFFWVIVDVFSAASVEKHDKLLHLMCDCGFTDATLNPWQKHRHIHACQWVSLTLGMRWKVRCGEREVGHIVELVWVVDVFMAATITNTPYFLLSNLYVKAHTCLLYQRRYPWFCVYATKNLLYILLIHFAAVHQQNSVVSFLKYSPSGCLTYSHKIRGKQSSHSFIFS